MINSVMQKGNLKKKALSDNFELSIIIPARNEEENLKDTIESLLKHIKGIRFEIIIVNDHSTDKTPQIGEKFASTYHFIKIINNEKKPGFANALLTGFENAKGDFVVPVMADGCDEFSIIPKMLEKAKEGYDVVCGSRYMKGGRRVGGPKFQGFFSRFVGLSLHYLLNLPTCDAPNAFKMYRKEILQKIDLKEKGFAISMEAVLKAYFSGYRITEIPTVWYGRKKGKSKFKITKTFPYIKLYLWAILKNFLEIRRIKKFAITELFFATIFCISTIKMFNSPLFFVKVISVEDASVFNKKPDSEMNVNFKNIPFSYKFPVVLSKKRLKKLNEEIKFCDSEFKKVIKICKWVREKLSFGKSNIHYYFWKPELVLEDAKKEKFECDGYARLSACIAQTFGIPSRVIWLGGHVIAEFYLSDKKRWVMVDPAYGCYLKSGKVVLSTTQIISLFEKGRFPEMVEFRNDEDDEPSPDLKKFIPVYTNKFTFLFSGENTEKGIKYTILHELKFPKGLQYREKDSPNLEMQGKIMRSLNIGSFLCLIFFPLLFKKWIFQL